KIIDTRFLVIDIERHRQVILGQASAGKPADVGSLKGESGSKFAADRKIEVVGIGSLQFIVDPPGDGQGAGINHGENTGRWLNEDLVFGVGVVGLGDDMHVVYTGSRQRGFRI